MTEPVVVDRVVRLSPLVRRLTQNNPGPFTGPGTNTHLIGTTEIIILDPGEDRDDGHHDRLVAAVGDARVTAIVPSHGHPDHWTLAGRLADTLRAPIRFFGTHPEFRVDQPIAADEILEAAGVRLHAFLTPGHTADHLCFHLAQERALFPGDMVMAWSTSIIAPPEGDLRHYLASLERLLAIPDLAVLYPAHGVAIDRPYDRMNELLRHRHQRTQQALDALAAGPSRLDAMVRRIYADVDPRLHPAAAQSLLAHLIALEADGRVEREGHPAEALDQATWRLSTNVPA